MITLGDKVEVPIAFNVINTIHHYSYGDVDEKGELSAKDQEISDAFFKDFRSEKEWLSYIEFRNVFKTLYRWKKTLSMKCEKSLHVC